MQLIIQMQSHNLIDDLDDLDDYSSDKDEVRLASHTISAEEAAADVEAIFRQFKGGKG